MEQDINLTAILIISVLLLYFIIGLAIENIKGWRKTIRKWKRHL